MQCHQILNANLKSNYYTAELICVTKHQLFSLILGLSASKLKHNMKRNSMKNQRLYIVKTKSKAVNLAKSGMI